MTPRQAAVIIGCSTRHTRTLISQGKLKVKLNWTTELSCKYSITHREAIRYRDRKTDGRGWPRGKPRKPKGAK